MDYFDTPMPSIWLVSGTGRPPRRDVLGLFNWADKDQAIGCPAAWAGLEASGTYYAFDFWANAPLPPFQGKFLFDVPAQSCRVIAVTAGDRAAGVSVSQKEEPGLVRVTLQSPTSREVAWTLQF